MMRWLVSVNAFLFVEEIRGGNFFMCDHNKNLLGDQYRKYKCLTDTRGNIWYMHQTNINVLLYWYVDP